MRLTRLTYYSDATTLINWSVVKDILLAAQKNNKRLNVTGLLISHGMRFLQTLEGDESVISELYRKIKLDVRHENLSLLELEPISQRQFPNWTMRGFEFEMLSAEKQQKILDRHFPDKREFYIPDEKLACLALIHDLDLVS